MDRVLKKKRVFKMKLKGFFIVFQRAFNEVNKTDFFGK